MGCIKSGKLIKKKIILLTVLLSLFAGIWIIIPSTETSGETIHPPAHVVISEIQAMGKECIELYNPTETPILIESWRLCLYSTSDQLENPSITRSFPEDASIPSNGFYLISIDASLTPKEDWNLGYGQSMLGGTGAVAIFSDSDITLGTKIDVVAVSYTHLRAHET